MPGRGRRAPLRARRRRHRPAMRSPIGRAKKRPFGGWPNGVSPPLSLPIGDAIADTQSKAIRALSRVVRKVKYAGNCSPSLKGEVLSARGRKQPLGIMGIAVLFARLSRKGSNAPCMWGSACCSFPTIGWPAKDPGPGESPICVIQSHLYTVVYIILCWCFST